VTAGAAAPYNTRVRRIGLAAVLVAAAALGVAAAASSAPRSLSRELALTKGIPCPDGARQPVGPKVVRRFHAVAAVSCVDGSRVYPHGGQWEVQVRRVAVGGVTRLQRYFERPSTNPQPPKGEVCAAVYVVTLVPLLVDAHGRSLLPLTPRGTCGEPLGGGPPNVRWHVVSVRKVKLVVSARALASDCPMRMGNTVAWAGPPHDAHAGTPLFERMPRTVRVCVFRTPADNFATGSFVRGFRLDRARTRRLLGALGGPGPQRGCPKQRNFATVGGGVRFGAMVELGGCYRVEGPDRTGGTAEPAVVRGILGG
jgi:hypothetical protein